MLSASQPDELHEEHSGADGDDEDRGCGGDRGVGFFHDAVEHLDGKGDHTRPLKQQGDDQFIEGGDVTGRLQDRVVVRFDLPDPR